MFCLKQLVSASNIKVIVQNIRYQSTTVNVNFKKIEPVVYKLIVEQLKKHSISKCSLNVEYSSMSKTYNGRFTATVDESKFHDNELNYYIEMSNNFASKN